MKLLIGFFINISFVNIFVKQSLANAYFNKTLMQEKFVSDFNKKCAKYKFVSKYLQSIQQRREDPHEKFVVFVFHEEEFRNGGLGDRIGGLISAFGISLRFNRTFLIKSSNGFQNLFQPYNPENSSIFTYGDWTSEPQYGNHYERNIETEYDLWQCINNADNQNSYCGMERGNVNQTVIKIRSNRAYLCKWAKSNLGSLKQEMKQVFGITKRSDLFQVAGCMLRLAMWPTNILWDAVGKLYKKIEKRNIKKISKKNKRKSAKKQHLIKQNSFTSNNSIDEARSFFQVGLHFRCGDKSYLFNGGYDRACVHDASGNDPHEESNYMGGGTPVGIGECAKQILQNKTLQIAKSAYDAKKQEVDVYVEGSMQRKRNEKQRYVQYVNSIAFIASDNFESSKQMKTILNNSHSLLTPQGCHMELDSSPECLFSTISYWFALSLSNVIVTQTFNVADNLHAPTSAFSRYAGMYGLQDNPFRSGKHCGVVSPTMLLFSAASQANWKCD